MISLRGRSPRSQNLRRRLAVTVTALVMALPLLVQPELWQYLTAALLVHDLMLRLAGNENQTTELPHSAQLPQLEREDQNDASDQPSEPDSVRASGHRI